MVVKNIIIAMLHPHSHQGTALITQCIITYCMYMVYPFVFETMQGEQRCSAECQISFIFNRVYMYRANNLALFIQSTYSVALK